MPAIAPVLELATLDGDNGFVVTGYYGGDEAGWSVASAGDVNGDGIDDFLVGAIYASTSHPYSGATYVVFGSTHPFPANFDPGTLDGTNGFRIDGPSGYAASGFSVAGLGDFNHDGVGDLIIGAPGVDSAGVLTGAAFVVFGKNTAVSGAFAPTLNLGTLTGADGFRMDGQFAHDRFGLSVASAGDINGDGIQDLMVGAWGADPGADAAGSTYIVFGRDTGVSGTFAASFDITTLDGTNGFRIDGANVKDLSGTSVAALGDVNGDGIGDIVIGAPGARPNGGHSGAAYVIFGRDTAIAGDFTGVLQLSSLDGSNGFALLGEGPAFETGHSVSSAGDVNGDGIDDILVGAYYGGAGGVYGGASYVVFGRAGGGFAANLQLSDLDGTNGFRLLGEQDYDYSGWSVASAGDLNNDGIDDLVIGAFRASPDGHRSGSTYVVFGRNTAADGDFTADVSLGGLTGVNGFKINGVYVAGASHNASGWSVASAGDVNSDGLNDLIIGGTGASAYGNNTGAAYIVYGMSPTIDGTPLADTLTGTGGRDRIYGLNGNDKLSGRQGDDSLYGGAGNDILDGGAGADLLDGGDGNDKLSGGDGGDSLTGGQGADTLNGEAGTDTLNGGDGNDTLDGGAGADVLRGGLGNDVYYVDDAGDQAIEDSGEGTDVVRAGITWTLGVNLEALELQGSADIDGTGNGLANRLAGNGGNNTLSGLAGVDTISGGGGDDRIIGGAGNDLMTGGAGADTFVILQESVFSSKAPAGRTLEIDQVYDLNKAQGDRLDLSAIDANASLAGDQAFSLVSAFTKHAGEMTLTYSAASSVTLLSLDTDGDGRADYQMKISGDVHLDSAGWVL